MNERHRFMQLHLSDISRHSSELLGADRTNATPYYRRSRHCAHTGRHFLFLSPRVAKRMALASVCRQPCGSKEQGRCRVDGHLHKTVISTAVIRFRARKNTARVVGERAGGRRPPPKFTNAIMRVKVCRTSQRRLTTPADGTRDELRSRNNNNNNNNTVTMIIIIVPTGNPNLLGLHVDGYFVASVFFAFLC